jgi:hypothetical protein
MAAVFPTSTAQALTMGSLGVIKICGFDASKKVAGQHVSWGIGDGD